MPDRRGSFTDLDEANPLRPLVGFALLAAAAVAVHPQGSDWRFLVLAALVFAGAGAVVGLKPGWLESAWLPLVPAASTLLAIALLRHSQGGSTSGYAPLAILVVVWVAIVASRRAVLLLTAGTALMFAVPLLLLGAPMYPSSGWRGAVLWTVVSYLVGRIVNATVSEQRRQAADATRHLAELQDLQKAFSGIAHVARDVSLGTDARELVCSAVISSTDATLANVVEPAGDTFAITGSAGVTIADDALRSVRPAASLAAFSSGRRVFIPDVTGDARISPVLLATGIVSVLFEPILRDGTSVGVLCVAWNEPRSEIDARTRAVVEFLAAEAGSAIERADLLAQLDGQAHSDPLTALPNRRAWDEALAKALAANATTCVAMIDLDHFKRYNDRHGHAAGDRLLRSCALAWKSHLRLGDTLARVGGEEFAVLLPGCSLNDARGILERLRRATPSGATASVGVAERLAGESASEVMARADAALYEAKETGRNQLRAA